MTRLVIDIDADSQNVTIDGSVEEAGELLGAEAFLNGKLQQTMAIASAWLLYEQGRISKDEYDEYRTDIVEGRLDLFDLMELAN